MSGNPYRRRQEILTGHLSEHRIHGVALNAGPSLTYLTGLHFHLMERPVVGLFTADRPPVLILPELEKGKLRGLEYIMTGYTYGEDPESWRRAFSEAFAAADADYRRIGIEPTRLRVLELRLIEEAAPHAVFSEGTGAISTLRIRKDAYEIRQMRRAVDIAQTALREMLKTIRPGVTERETAAELTVQMLRAGGEPELPFQPIVAFGPATANPHAVPSNRPLAAGDLMLIDWGAASNGYFSDLTRMFAFGEPDPELARITEMVRSANQAAREAVRPGIAAAEVDRVARDVIADAGYGEFFIHRTGHGLGLEAHEEPYIRSDNRDRLEVGMTFTIEPGIYLPERGGARIEDDVVVTETGAESLSDLERSLVKLA